MSIKEAICGSEILVSAPKIECRTTETMVSSNSFKLCGRFGKKKKGKLPEAIVNSKYTKDKLLVKKEKAIELIDIENNLCKLYSRKSIDLSVDDSGYISGNKLFAEHSNKINPEKDCKIKKRSAQDKGQFIIVFGSPAVSYVDLNLDVQVGAKWTKL